MSGVPTPQQVIAMRDAMALVQRASGSGDKRAGLDAVKACWLAAKAFFAGDPESLASFRERMEGLRDDLKAGRYDASFQVAEHVRQQLQSLALMLAGSGQLPELLDELRQVQGEMTRFDHYVGRLCEQTYQPAGSPTATLMYGMLAVLEFALDGELDEDDTPEALIREKSEQNDQAASDCEGHRTSAVLLDAVWPDVERQARADRVPRLVQLTTMLVRTAEMQHPRPPGPITRGHYYAVASFVFGTGLQFAARHQELASELVAERAEYTDEE